MNASPVTPPRILVLLAARNGAPWIREQIDSILRQCGVEVGIVVADDASTDGTVSLLARYDRSGVNVVAREQPSGSAAQNFLSLIRSTDANGFEFVAFSDQDDVWCRDKLSRAAAALAGRHCAGYSSAVTACWPAGRRRLLRQKPLITESDFLFESAGQGCTYVVTREFYCRARHFLLERQDLTGCLHYHDWAMYALARAWHLHWAFDAHSTIDYRQHPHNDTGAKLSLGGASRRLRRIANGWYRGQISAIHALAAAANPSDPVIGRWGALVRTRPGLKRRLDIARFCIRGGRRKMSDNVVLIGSALMGWI